ncbi:MAG: cytochrome c oxidase subunit II [Desulfurococcales archaeon]|nr:cytochrome c oxidase subunit II [Desulfurococcales archaeon]
MEGKEERLEYVWIAVIILMLTSFLGLLGYATIIKGYSTPEDVVTCEVKKLDEQITPGIEEVAPGVYVVNITGRQWSWTPNEITLENPKKVIFRVTSADVVHGFQIVGTNVNFMVFPGYIAEITWYPPSDLEGEHLIVCNEYCGIAHQDMWAKLVIERG